MRNETTHCAKTLKEISLKLAIERATATPMREAHPYVDTLREAMRTRLIKFSSHATEEAAEVTTAFERVGRIAHECRPGELI